MRRLDLSTDSDTHREDPVAPAVGPRPVLVGEVLFDVFHDQSRRLGGAPFNVAWHLQGLGLAPLLVTRVGADAAGQEILTKMRAWGMDLSAVQQDTLNPTGEVLVRCDTGAPTFEISADQAYDHLELDRAVCDIAATDTAVVYHGTLICRSTQASTALQAIRASTAAPVFLDVNLRPPWWDHATVSRALLGTRWVKLNRDELGQLRGLGPEAGRDDLARAAREFRLQHALEAVIVTLGKAGVIAAWRDQLLDTRPRTVVTNDHPVGAGDAFSAAVIAGLLLGWDPGTCLGRALDLAAITCTIPGAVCEDLSLYEALRREWRSH